VNLVGAVVDRAILDLRRVRRANTTTRNRSAALQFDRAELWMPITTHAEPIQARAAIELMRHRYTVGVPITRAHLPREQTALTEWRRPRIARPGLDAAVVNGAVPAPSLDTAIANASIPTPAIHAGIYGAVRQVRSRLVAADGAQRREKESGGHDE
jgi:hypothetical protein